jgi:hypothetical protein
VSALARARATAFTSSVATVAWFGVLLQAYLSLRTAEAQGQGAAFGLVNFLSFFTVLTNILVCLTLTLPAALPRLAAGRFFARNGVRAGIAAYIVFVGLSYHFLLRHIWNPQGWQKVADLTLHYAVPLLYLLYWWFFAHKRGLRWYYVLLWCVYPVVYLGYVLVRGALTGLYPYYFIDVGKLGYERTLLNAAAMLGAFVVLGVLFVVMGRQRAPSPP